jgi:IS605 OrfB family transposase
MVGKKATPKGLTLVFRTIRAGIKDKHAALLERQAGESNFVRNFTQEMCSRHLERAGKFMSAFDVAAYTKGATNEGLSLNSQNVQAVSEEHARRRRQFMKRKLSWRSSKGTSRSLGWISFKASAIACFNGQVHYQRAPISLWDSYGLKDYKPGTGRFSEDSRGRWNMNVSVKVKKAPKPVVFDLNQSALGVELGLKDLVAGSNGFKVEAHRFYRDLEPKLAVAQRAGKRDRVKAIHAKVSNRRKDFLHKESSRIVASHAAVFVGNANASALAKTKMAKSVLDSGWSTLRTMLKYKCDDAGVWFKEVNESYSTQECSTCHRLTGPKGQAELGVRQWTCVHCLGSHDRDVNAGMNIRNRGLELLETEFCVGVEARAFEASANKDSQDHLAQPDLAATPCYGRPAEEIPCL